MANKKDTWSGEHYKKHFPKDKGWIISYLENIKFNGNETILDIGCGNEKEMGENLISRFVLALPLIILVVIGLIMFEVQEKYSL